MNRFPLWWIPRLRGIWWSIGPAKNKYNPWLFKIKKNKTKSFWVWFGESGCRIPKIHCTWIFERDLPSQIIFILNRKGYFKQSNPLDHQKDEKRQFARRSGEPEAAKNIVEMETFHSTRCKAYPHDKLNTTKVVIRCWELSLATPVKIRTAKGEQSVTDNKKITIRRDEEVIQTTK